VEQFKPGAKIKATTITELGNRNRPLDMIGYKKGGKDYILMANSARGLMKVDAANIDKYAAIESRIADKAGMPYETFAEYANNVTQLDKVDDTSAVILVADADKKSTLKTIALP
jgi:soluble P-type ATPase